MRKLPAVLLALALILGAAPSEAKIRDKSWELFAFVGNLDHRSGDEITNGVDYGLSVGYFGTAKVGVETRFSTDEAEFEGNPTTFERAMIELSGNFLSDRDTSTFPYIVAGLGVVSETRDAFEDPNGVEVLESYDAAAVLTMGLGARTFFHDDWAIRYEARYFHHDLFEASQDEYEISAGVSWILGGKREPKPAPPDEDGDGVHDKKDKCPGTPKGATVDEKGCPSDLDGDGVWNGLDKCPDTPKPATVDETGCLSDTDGDTVPDDSDKCPGTPKGAKVDASGCPSDGDSDGVYDGLDTCPDTPAGAKVDAKGCPLDGDKDGVYDGLDRCPDTPAGDKVDAAGCSLPKPAPDPFAGRKSLVLEGVAFGSSNATLSPESATALDAVAASLIEWPEVKIEIAGHTDSQDDEADNLKLSQARAESVRDYLVSNGVDPSRLTAKGYGESEPIDDNATKEGRARNRRVELVRLN